MTNVTQLVELEREIDREEQNGTDTDADLPLPADSLLGAQLETTADSVDEKQARDIDAQALAEQLQHQAALIDIVEPVSLDDKVEAEGEGVGQSDGATVSPRASPRLHKDTSAHSPDDARAMKQVSVASVIEGTPNAPTDYLDHAIASVVTQQLDFPLRIQKIKAGMYLIGGKRFFVRIIRDVSHVYSSNQGTDSLARDGPCRWRLGHTSALLDHA